MATTFSDPALVPDILPSDLRDVEFKTPFSGSFSAGEGPIFIYFLYSRPLKTDVVVATSVSLHTNSFLPTTGALIPDDHYNKGWKLINTMDNNKLVIQPKQPDDSKGICIVDPLSSTWALHARLPPSQPSYKNRIVKVAMLGDIAIAICISRRLLYTTPQRKEWILLYDNPAEAYMDVTLCKSDGLFYALEPFISKVISIRFQDDAEFEIEDVTSDLVAPDFDPSKEEYHGWSCCQEARLVDSPSCLFLVRWRRLIKKGEGQRREVDVFKLLVNGANRTWVPVSSLGNYSFFFAHHQTIAVPCEHFPNLKSNRICLCYDAAHMLIECGPDSINIGSECDKRETFLVYNLDDGSWDTLSGTTITHTRGLAAHGVWLIPPQRESLLKRKREEPQQTEITCMPGETHGN